MGYNLFFMPHHDKRPTRVRLSDMPLVPLCLPLMLIFLSWFGVGTAFACLGVVALVFMFVYWREGGLAQMRISMLMLVLHSGLFYLGDSTIKHYIDNRLWHQTLWLVAFVLVQCIAFVAIRRGKFPRLERAACCCDQRRNEALMAEYIRFDKFLLRFSLLAISFYLPASSLMRPSPELELVMTQGLAVVSLVMIAFELYQLAWIRRQLERENWIPILDTDNQVVGRTPRSAMEDIQSLTIGEGILPRVRLLALTPDGMIYLERQKPCGAGEDAQLIYDTPFADWLSEDDRPESIAQRMIDARFCGIRRAHPRALLPYRIKLGERNILVSLMIVEIESPDLLHIDCRPIEGKWWSIEDVSALANEREFSTYLLNELPILMQTIFFAQRLR